MAKTQAGSFISVPYSLRNGGLVSDADVKNISEGNLYVDAINTGALNIRSVGRGMGVSPSYEPMYGNVFKYKPDTLAVQNKLFRLYLDVTNAEATSDIEFTLSTPSGNVLATYADTIDSSDITNALSDTDGFLTTELAAFTIVTSTTITGTYTGYIDIEFQAAPYFNYQFAFDVTDGDTTSETEVVQESVDPSMLGDWKLIGSNDKIGDCFQFFTTRFGLPASFDILNITNPSGTLVRVQTVLNHGFIENQSVEIQGVVGLPEVNGIWTITNPTIDTFDLLLCEFIGAGYVEGGTVTTNIYGVGEIGVTEFDNNGEVGYTRLLRSNEFNFSTLMQIDCRVKRKQDDNIAIYFTETTPRENRIYQNAPRVFYYKGAYTQDGGIEPNGIYEYGRISSELAWIQSNSDFSLRWVSQTQSGGAIKSGNWRYAARLLTANFVETQFSLLTDTVPVFDYNYEAAPLVIGDVPNVVTPKINVLELTNNMIGLFKYVEIAAVNYIGDNGFAAYILGRYELNGQTTQYIEHTGNENNLIDLDAGELNQVAPGFILAQNVELLESRAILSNLTPAQTLDFTEWVETFGYSLEREGLTPIGVWPTYALQSGEYQLPTNVYSKKSHMMYEQYRYGFRFKLKSGGYTQVFYPGYDIRIDLPATLPPERVAGSFTTFDLTDNNAAPTEVYSIYINWLNINLSYLIDGIPVYDLIDEIAPCRATVIPEVLGHGAVVLGVSGVEGDSTAPPTDLYYYGTTYLTPATGPFPYISGRIARLAAPVIPANPTYAQGTQGAGAFGFDPERATVFFYSPDISFRQQSFTHVTGDQIICFGAPERHDEYSTLPASTRNTSLYAEYNGYSGISANPTPISINDSLLMPFNGGELPQKLVFPPSTVVGGVTVSLTYGDDLLFPPDPPEQFPFIVDIGVACVMAANVNNSGGNTDYGFYRAIYYRPQTNKYNDPNTTVYTESLEPYVLGDFRGIIPSMDFVTYGDVFTQKTYLKYRYPGWFDRIPTQPTINDGFGMGVGYYSQNRNNLQLRTKPTADYTGTAVIQQLPIDAWLVFGYADPASIAFGNMLFYPLFRDSQLFYNRGYTPRNEIVSANAFNASLDYQTDWGNAIAWSNIEVEGSNTDNLRTFPPLNIKFLDFTQGAITGAFSLNNQLITVQPREVQRQFFNTTSMMTTLEGTEVILGSGAVMSNRGTTMNKFGSSHKWSLIIGLSDKGHDVLYGIDDFNRIAWRLGYDGTVAMDELFGMKSFFANNLSWTKGKYTPAHDEGIRGVSNQRYKELIWTVRARKAVEEWEESTTTVQVIPFESGLGTELLVNPNLNGSMYGWLSEDAAHAPDPTVWTWDAGTTYPFIKTAPGNDGYLRQEDTVPFVVGRIYQIYFRTIVSSNSVTSVNISFQSGGSGAFSYLTSGDYYLTYAPVPGDDNIYFYYQSAVFPGQAAVIITQVSIKEIITTPNWLGAPTWTIGNNQATADGTDGDELVHDVPDYIVSGATNILSYTLDDVTVGDVTVHVADMADTPRTADGTYEFTTTPTVTGVIKFVPANSFEGTVKGNLKLTTIVPRRYDEGDVVMVTPGDNFHLLPDMYVALVDDPVGIPTPFNTDWELIPHTDSDYYNEYTIVFSEIKNKFQSFASFLPLIYAKFQNTYLVPRPVSDTGRMYLADEGLPTTWFQEDVSVLTSDAYFDATINQPTGRNRYLALRVESDIAVAQINVTTPTGRTFMLNSDAVQREGNEFDYPVKADSVATGLNTGNTSIMQGDWGLFRFIISATTYNKINSFICKLRSRARTWNS